MQLARATGKNPGSNLLAIVRLRHDARSSAGAAEVARVVRTLKGLGAQKRRRSGRRAARHGSSRGTAAPRS